MDTLPVEIQNTIHELCLPDYLQDRVPSPSVAPQLLASVCSSWRETASSNPRLWTSLSITIDPEYRPAEMVERAVERWSALSDPFLISLLITLPFSTAANRFRSATSTPFVPHLDAVHAILSHYGHRVSIFHLDDSPELLVKRNFLHIPFPNLQSASFRALEQWASTMSMRWIDYLPNRGDPKPWPKLKRIQFVDDVIPADLESFPSWLPLAQLTHISLTVQAVSHLLLPIFQNCHVLEKCSLRFMDSIDVSTPSPPVVTHRALRYLHLQTDQPTTGMLQGLFFPFLTHLNIERVTFMSNVFDGKPILSRLVPPNDTFFDPAQLQSLRLRIIHDSREPSLGVTDVKNVVDPVLHLLEYTNQLRDLELFLRTDEVNIAILKALSKSRIVPNLSRFTATVNEESVWTNYSELDSTILARAKSNCKTLGVVDWKVRLLGFAGEITGEDLGTSLLPLDGQGSERDVLQILKPIRFYQSMVIADWFQT